MNNIPTNLEHFLAESPHSDAGWKHEVFLTSFSNVSTNDVGITAKFPAPLLVACAILLHAELINKCNDGNSPTKFLYLLIFLSSYLRLLRIATLFSNFNILLSISLIIFSEFISLSSIVTIFLSMRKVTVGFSIVPLRLHSKSKTDAVVLEGPKSGGHQGFTYEQCEMEEFQLENLVAPVVEEAKKWGNIPVFAAGGVWDKKDIEEMMALGAVGVQMGTRFIGTFECDAHDNFKEILLNAKKEDIQLMGSPVGYPARGVRTNLTELVEKREGPAIKCISNCVAPCHRGVEAKEVGFCIADRLSDAYNGNKELGLFFSGTNGYRLDKLISVKELMEKLVDGE